MIINYVVVVKQIFRSSFQTIRENIGGPIAIAQQSYTAAQQGVVWFFEMFAMFNIVLAFMNLLPIPILDGGHIVFATIETIIRRPLPARFQVVVYNVFFALFMGLVVLVFYNDIVMNAWRVFQ
jgi:regulator of sigma E protease